MTDKIELELTPTAPSVELEPFGEALEKPFIPEPDYLGYANLSEEEKTQIDTFSETIDIKDSNIVLQYGAAAQNKLTAFSNSALEGVKTKDLGEIGNEITSLITELKGFDIDESEKGLSKFFKKKANSLTQFKTKYTSAEKNINGIVGTLQDHQNQLVKDIVMLDKMYDCNLQYFKELTMYIIAGKNKLEKEQTTTLVELKNKAKASGLAEDAQAANDFAALCDRFDKRLHDLELTRAISMQMAPQIRMIQNNDSLMSEKIQSTITNTIPLWKNQMVLALSLEHSEEALNAEREVNEFTNQLIEKNAEKLKTGAIAVATESEKSIVSIESVKYANNQLIETLDEVVKIQAEGRVKRREAETELAKIEVELKEKLLDIRNTQLGDNNEQ